MPFLKKKYRLKNDPYIEKYDYGDDYDSDYGAFQDPSSIYGDWIYCREEWGRNYHTSKLKRFFFGCKKEEAKRIARFINTVENRIARNNGGIGKKRSKFGYTTSARKRGEAEAIWVEPIKFWNECPMRRSLFTALLRCGRNYKNNFEKVLPAYDYTKTTKNAIDLFLKGYTEIIKKGDYYDDEGWVDRFERMPVKKCKTLLKKPSK